MREIVLRAIGYVEQVEGEICEVVLRDEFVPGLEGLKSGQEILILFWMDRARRDVLRVHPHGNPMRPPRGVFATRSPHRPNPIGATTVELLSVQGGRLRVRGLDAWEGTPILDIKIGTGATEEGRG
ncbi:tRNA (N6-threonylcarbamoyladenosine(37)-N6)-methyltransferase TrmO [Candidatus Acetothermia bacterium]|nr:MAG: tRNA (N6-threonylcarbamoyladenosine(37)-N6)-methyltransferase TrmO [Candidatus Acetothermia bacterium]